MTLVYREAKLKQPPADHSPDPTTYSAPGQKLPAKPSPCFASRIGR